jgi:hypothetical protein
MLLARASVWHALKEQVAQVEKQVQKAFKNPAKLASLAFIQTWESAAAKNVLHVCQGHIPAPTAAHIALHACQAHFHWQKQAHHV